MARLYGYVDATSSPDAPEAPIDEPNEFSEIADESDFVINIADHHRAALRLAFLLTGDRARAEDVSAEALARVLVACRKGNVHDARAYLRMAVANEVRGGWRRLRLDRRMLARRTGDGRGPRADDDQVVDEDAVWQAIGKLAPGQRDVLVLRYYENLSEAEIAEVLSVSVGTVKSRAARALVHLRSIMAEQEERDESV